MIRDELTKEQLAALLRQAEQAHAEYEMSLGKRDDDWPAWYADFIVNKLKESGAAGSSGSSW